MLPAYIVQKLVAPRVDNRLYCVGTSGGDRIVFNTADLLHEQDGSLWLFAKQKDTTLDPIFIRVDHITFVQIEP